MSTTTTMVKDMTLWMVDGFGEFFSGSAPDDFVLSTTASSQSILIGAANASNCTAAQTISDGAVRFDRLTNLSCNAVMAAGTTLYSSTVCNVGSIYTSHISADSISVPGLTSTYLSSTTLSNSGALSTASITASNIFSYAPGGFCNVGANTYTTTLSNAGNASVLGGLAVGGVLALGDTTLSAAASDNGRLTIGGDVLISGALTVATVTYIQSNLTLFCSETIQSNLTVDNSLTTSNLVVTAAAQTGSLSNSGNMWTASLQSQTLSNSGNASVSGAMAVGGAATVSGTATVSGLATLQGGAAVSGLTQTATLCNSGALVSSSVYVSGAGLFAPTFSNVGGATYAATLCNAGAASFGGSVGVGGDGTFAGTVSAAKLVTTGPQSTISTTTLCNSGTLVSSSVYAAQGLYGAGFSNTSVGNTYVATLCNVGVASIGRATVGTLSTTTTTATSALYASNLSNVGGVTYAGYLQTQTQCNLGAASVGGLLTTAGQANSGTITSTTVVVSGGGLYGTAFSNLTTGVTYAGTLSNSGLLAVGGHATVGDGLTLSSLGTKGTVQLSATASNGLYVAGDVVITGNLVVDSVTYLQSNVTVFCSETIQSNLTVDNVTTTNTLVVQALAQTATLSNTGDASLGGLLSTVTLSNSGNASISGVATIAGHTTMKAGAAVTGLLAVTGSATVSSTATITGLATMLGGVSVSGLTQTATICNSGAIVSSNVYVLGGGLYGAAFSNTSAGVTYAQTLCNAGNLGVGGSVSVVGSLGVAGAATVTGLLTTSAGISNSGGSITSAGDVRVTSGGLYTPSFSNVGGYTYIAASCNAGSASISGSVAVGGSLGVLGAAQVGGLVSLCNSVNVASNVTQGGTVTATQLVTTGPSSTIAGTLGTTTMCNTGSLVSANVYATQGLYGSAFSNTSDGSTYTLNSYTAGTSTVGGLLTALHGLAVSGGTTTTAGQSNVGDVATTSLHVSGGGLYGTSFSNLTDGTTYAATMCNLVLSAGSAQLGSAVVTGQLTTSTVVNSASITTQSLFTTGGGLYGSNFSNVGGVTYAGYLQTQSQCNLGAASVGGLLTTAGQANSGTITSTSVVVSGGGLYGTAFSNLASGVTYAGTLSNSGLLAVGGHATVGDGLTLSSLGTAGTVQLSATNCNGLYVAGDVVIGGSLVVDSVSYFHINVTVFTSETIQSNLTITDTLTVGTTAYLQTLSNACNAWVGGSLSVAGSASVAGTLQTVTLCNASNLVTQNVYVGQGMYGQGFSNLPSGATYASTLAVAGVVSTPAFSNSAASPATLYTTTLSNAGDASVGCNLTVQGNLDINGTLMQFGIPYIGSQWTNYSNAQSNGIYYNAQVNMMNVSASNLAVAGKGSFGILQLCNALDGSSVTIQQSNGYCEIGGNVKVDGALNVTSYATVGGLTIRRANASNSGQAVVLTSLQGYCNDPTGVCEYFTARAPTDSFRFNVSNASGGEVMRVTAAGQVGILTQTPTETLTVAGSVSFAGSAIAGGGPRTILSTTATSAAQYISPCATSNLAAHTWYKNGVADVAGSNLLLTLDFQGGLNARGDISTNGELYAHSDVRLKTSLQPIDRPLERVGGIVGYTFERIDEKDSAPGKRHTGVLAQDVLKVLPEAVNNADDTSGTRMMSVAYGNLAGLFAEAIKELTSRVASLSEQVVTLKTRVATLESEASARSASDEGKGKGKGKGKGDVKPAAASADKKAKAVPKKKAQDEAGPSSPSA